LIKSNRYRIFESITTACTGAQKAGGLGNSGFIIKRTSFTARIFFVPCEAEPYMSEAGDEDDGRTSSV